MANLPRHDDEADHVMGAHPALLPVDHVQRRRRLLDAGRLLLTGGWLVLINTVIGNSDTNAEHALFGFVLLLLGAFLITLSPVAHRFPGATRFGTAVADAVLFYFLEVAPAGN